MPLTRSEALERVQSVPVRLKVLQTGLKAAADTLLLLLQPLGIVLGLFVLHQLLFWANSDPVRSFGVARGLVEGSEFVFDTLGSLWNLLGEAANSAVIPLWNSISFYIFEPGISLVIEVFALVFTRKSFQGVVSEAQLPYKGFYCNSLDSASMAFCGRYQAYEARLEAGNSGVKDGSLTFGTATARRLSELADGEFVTPSFDGQELVGALDGMATQGIVMGASGADAFFAVAYEILSTTAVLLFDAIFIIVKAIFVSEADSKLFLFFLIHDSTVLLSCTGNTKNVGQVGCHQNAHNLWHRPALGSRNGSGIAGPICSDRRCYVCDPILQSG